MATVTTPAGTHGPLTLTETSLSRPTWTVAHEVPGRADAIAVLGPLRARTGTLTFTCPTIAAADLLVHTCAGARIVLGAVEHPGLHQMPCVVHDAHITPVHRLAGGWLWRVDLTVTEVA